MDLHLHWFLSIWCFLCIGCFHLLCTCSVGPIHTYFAVNHYFLTILNSFIMLLQVDLSKNRFFGLSSLSSLSCLSHLFGLMIVALLTLVTCRKMADVILLFVGFVLQSWIAVYSCSKCLNFSWNSWLPGHFSLPLFLFFRFLTIYFLGSFESNLFGYDF